MSLVTETFTIGTAIERIVPGLHYSQDVIVQNLEPLRDSNDLSRDGYLYLVGSEFTVPANGTAIFNIATPASGLQIEFYEIVSSDEVILASLIENGTPTTGGTVASYNINRQEADDAEAVFTQATAYTGGTVVSQELVTASKQGAGGMMSLSKIHTLKPSTSYGMRFVSQGNQASQCFVQIGFAEKFNGQNDVTVGDENGKGFTLKGGQMIQLRTDKAQSVYAVSEESAEIVVVRQN